DRRDVDIDRSDVDIDRRDVDIDRGDVHFPQVDVDVDEVDVDIQKSVFDIEKAFSTSKNRSSTCAEGSKFRLFWKSPVRWSAAGYDGARHASWDQNALPCAPSTGMHAPEIQLARGDSRNATTVPTSSGRPKRPNGRSRRTKSAIPAGSACWRR